MICCNDERLPSRRRRLSFVLTYALTLSRRVIILDGGPTALFGIERSFTTMYVHKYGMTATSDIIRTSELLCAPLDGTAVAAHSQFGSNDVMQRFTSHFRTPDLRSTWVYHL